MRIITAEVKYAFNNSPGLSQFWYSQLAVTSFPISRTDPMIRIGTAAAANIAISPAIENQAATAAIDRAVMNVRIAKGIITLFIC
jgi:hypothetical protein